MIREVIKRLIKNMEVPYKSSDFFGFKLFSGFKDFSCSDRGVIDTEDVGGDDLQVGVIRVNFQSALHDNWTDAGPLQVKYQVSTGNIIYRVTL